MANVSQYKFLLAIDGSAHANRAAEYLVRRAAGLRPCEVHLVNVLPLRLAGLLTLQQQDLLLEKLKLSLPAQPSPKITAAQLPSATPLLCRP